MTKVTPMVTSKITTHVLDLDYAGSAVGMTVLLEFLSADGWQETAQGSTDTSGRIEDLFVGDSLIPGVYRLSYSTKNIQWILLMGKHRIHMYQ